MENVIEAFYLKDVYSTTYKTFVRIIVTEEHLLLHKVDGVNGFITERNLIVANSDNLKDYRIASEKSDCEVVVTTSKDSILLDFNNADEPPEFFLALMLITK